MKSPPLTQRLRLATRDLHPAAERAGMMPALLRGELERDRYVLMLRNLHALYGTLELALARHAQHPCVAPLCVPGLARAAALVADLEAFHGGSWQRLPMASAMQAYCRHIEALARSLPSRLAAHVYVRYLGDLSGGQVLRGIVRQSLQHAGGTGTAFYHFGSDDEARALKDALKRGLDQVPCDEAEAAAIAEEARDGFARHIAFFEELDRPRQPSSSLPAA